MKPRTATNIFLLTILALAITVKVGPAKAFAKIGPVVPMQIHAQVLASCPNGALHCIGLSWTAPAVDATHGAALSYNVYRATTTGACATSPATATGCTKATNVTTLTDTDSGLAASTAYFYVVTAVNASGESAPSNQATATTGSDPAPNAPGNLNVTGNR